MSTTMEETIKQLQAETKEKTHIIDELKQGIMERDRQIYFLRNDAANQVSVDRMKAQILDLHVSSQNHHDMLLQEFRSMQVSMDEMKIHISDLRGIYENNHDMWKQDFQMYTSHFHDRIDDLHKLIEENLSPRKRKFVKEDRPSPWA